MNTNESTAVKIQNELRNTPVVFPDGEFTIKQIIAQTGKSQPSIYLAVQAAIKAGTVEEVRREQGGRGRPTVIYKKV